MYITEVAEIYAKGFMCGRKDCNAKLKAIDAAILYTKPRTEIEEIIIRKNLWHLLS